MAYKELDGMDYVLYYNDSLEKLHPIKSKQMNMVILGIKAVMEIV